jgi:SHS2 domain-containing protein
VNDGGVAVPVPYEFFEHTADIGVTAYGTTLSELFHNAVSAMYNALGKFELSSHDVQRTLNVQADSAEDLLHDWLAELLYELETHHVLYEQIDLTKVDRTSLSARLCGGTIDFARSQTNEEIKAVTYHQLRVEQTPDGTWRATMIFDV